MITNSIQMKAVKKFKSLIEKKRPEAFAGTLGKGVRTLHMSSSGDGTIEPTSLHRSKSVDIDDRRNVEQALASEGVHHDAEHAVSKAPGLSRLDLSVVMVDEPSKS